MMHEQFEGMMENEILSKDRVLSQSIPWEGYQRAELLTDAQVSLIGKYDKRSVQQKQALAQKDGAELAQLFLDLVQKINNPGTLQYVVALIDEFFSIHPGAAVLFLQIDDGKRRHSPFTPFLRLLQHREPEYRFIKMVAGRIVALMLNAREKLDRMDEVRQLYAFIVEQLRRRDVPVELHIGLVVLQDLLGKNEMRSFFYQEGGVELLTSVIESNPSAQIVYETVVCIWLLNYNPEVATRIGEFRVVQILVGLLKSQTKEKVIRVTVAALRNLSNKADNNETMIDHGMIRVLQTLNNKKWADEEIIADLEALTASVSATVTTMSSWDRYTKELSSGKLEWTPVHHNENFWRDNAAKFEEQGYTHLNMLHELIKGRDAQSRAIACFDLGEFARFHPQGKQILQRLGIKVDIMGLLTDDDAAVRKEALFAVQKTIPNYKFMV